MMMKLSEELTFTGRQTTISKRSAVARLARNVLVGHLNDDFFITVRMIRMFPDTPRQNVKLKNIRNVDIGTRKEKERMALTHL